ncbi:MAG: DNA polymerase IV [Verrucomicrobiales bacterium]|nr:DNA polymerase IV [Verrucomicrobiales bacterium]
MDCFYAAIEMRERPELAGKPVAVGGRNRGVLTTCNYEARKFGCHSAMPTYLALRKCPRLVVVPVNSALYRETSQQIRRVFEEFTELVEPLSLDEAYLDVSHLHSEGGSVAGEVRARIKEATQLTASAGIAPNKFLAKIASDWEKPDGQFEIVVNEVEAFMVKLPVEKIWGVGKRTAEKLHRLGLETCEDLQQQSLVDLDRRFGKFGQQLYELCRGIDERAVNPDRERKSLSNERTFSENVERVGDGQMRLLDLIEELIQDYQQGHSERQICGGFVKLKFNDFSVTTAQRAMKVVDRDAFVALLADAWQRGQGKAVRLIGAGIRFVAKEKGEEQESQLELL